MRICLSQLLRISPCSRTIAKVAHGPPLPARLGSLLYPLCRNRVAPMEYLHWDSVCGDVPANWSDFLVSSPGSRFSSIRARRFRRVKHITFSKTPELSSQYRAARGGDVGKVWDRIAKGTPLLIPIPSLLNPHCMPGISNSLFSVGKATLGEIPPLQ